MTINELTTPNNHPNYPWQYTTTEGDTTYLWNDLGDEPYCMGWLQLIGPKHLIYTGTPTTLWTIEGELMELEEEGWTCDQIMDPCEIKHELSQYWHLED